MKENILHHKKLFDNLMKYSGKLSSLKHIKIFKMSNCSHFFFSCSNRKSM